MTYPPRRRWSFFDIDFSHREWSFLPTMLSRCWFVRNPNHYFRSSLSTFSLLLFASFRRSRCFIRLLAASLCSTPFRRSRCFSLLHSPSRCILSLVRPFVRLLPGVNPLFVPPSQLFIGLSAGLFVRWFVRMDFRTICHSI